MRIASVLGLAFALFSTPIVAQECAPAALENVEQCVDRRDFETYRPRVNAARIDYAQISDGAVPVIDGDLSDPAWSQASVIEEFYQIEPVGGATPSQPTRALIMYDSKNLYVGIYSYDTEPDQIRRAQMQRDPRLQDDDAVRILIDSYGTFRDSFFFGINPNGARSDALTENGSSFRDEWKHNLERQSARG